MVGRAGEPVIRLAVRQAMRIMGHQFVMGRTIEEAQDRAAQKDNAAYRYSYDMLGEGGADRSRCRALHAGLPRRHSRLGKRGPWKDVLDAPAPSLVKLSAAIRATSIPSAHACCRTGAARAGTGATGHGTTASA
jgi:RHH-type proline utilization regulon transcriptional repressor/proline dehydrogenase/delta 1-pyrroline-5-carboxylate dehydrogenase